MNGNLGWNQKNGPYSEELISLAQLSSNRFSYKAVSIKFNYTSSFSYDNKKRIRILMID